MRRIGLLVICGSSWPAPAVPSRCRAMRSSTRCRGRRRSRCGSRLQVAEQEDFTTRIDREHAGDRAGRSGSRCRSSARARDGDCADAAAAHAAADGGGSRRLRAARRLLRPSAGGAGLAARRRPAEPQRIHARAAAGRRGDRRAPARRGAAAARDRAAGRLGAQASQGVNIALFAKQTTHAVGERRYSRPATARASAAAATAGASPRRTRRSASSSPAAGRSAIRTTSIPTGDGFACGWNPEPFRRLGM
jgi:hypothetical protein